jgi:hypothetical protein
MELGEMTDRLKTHNEAHVTGSREGPKLYILLLYYYILLFSMKIEVH